MSSVEVPSLPPVSSTLGSFYEDGERSEGFSINFIRRYGQALRVRRIALGVMGGYVLGQILCMGWLFGSAQHSWVKAQEIQEAMAGQMPVERAATLEQDVATLHGQAIEDLAKVQPVVKAQKQRFFVGGKLGVLTKTLPARTWILGISGKREERRLLVQAAYLMDPKVPYGLPVKDWMAVLRADPVFSKDLASLDLTASSRQRQGRAELYAFTLMAKWK